MLTYNQPEKQKITIGNKFISCFNISSDENIDLKTVESFGKEWTKFDSFNTEEISNIGDEYFDIITEAHVNKNSYVLDLGCGTGRWTKYLAPQVKFIEAVDPSEAVLSAANLLKNETNVRVTQSSVDNLPFEDNSFDFAFSLGVLHHIPNTEKALSKIVAKLKPEGYLLLYLYYNLDNRGNFYKLIFNLSSIFRKVISQSPTSLKQFICDTIAITVYIPFITMSRVLKNILPKQTLWKKIPLSYYVEKSFNVIRNDALDRFGTPLEQRFSKEEITKMMESCGLTNITFSNKEPYWHAVGKKST